MTQLYNPKNLNLDSIFAGICHPDYARMFIHLVLATTYKFKHKETEFVPLNSVILRKQIHGRKTELIKKILIKEGIIECDGMFCPKLKCYGYRIAKKYQNCVTTIRASRKCLIKKLKKEPPKLTKPQHVNIWNWLNKVNIDYKQAQYLLENTKNVTQKSLMLEKLHNKDFFFVEDERGRVYHNVACLWTKFRKLLSINDINLVNIDIKNSQPLIFCKILKSNYLVYTTTKSVASFCPSDVTLFTTLAEQGKLYDFLMERLNVRHRNSFKKKFFAEVFYAKVDYDTKLSKSFAELFPNVAKVISFCKKDGYKNLPLEMQRIEAELMIGQVSAQLGDIPFLTVHDSILTFPQHVEFVKSVISNVFNKTGLNPSFGV